MNRSHGELRAGMAVRWARAAAVSSVAVTLGAGAHWTAGQQNLDPVVLGFVLVALTAVSAAALSYRASLARLMALVAGGQLLVHMLLGLGGHGGMDHSAVTAEMPAAAHSSPVSSLLMLVLHAAAAACVAVWLERGERLIWSLLCLLAGHSVQFARSWRLDQALANDIDLLASTTRRLVNRHWPRSALTVALCPARRGPPQFAICLTSPIASVHPV